MFTPEDRAQGRLVTELCLALDEGRAVNERWHLRRDGTRFWASGLVTPLLDARGQPWGFLNIMLDHAGLRGEVERQAMLVTEMGQRLRDALFLVQAGQPRSASQ